MNSSHRRRQYFQSLDYVQSGFQACWRNSQDLVAASGALLGCNLHAPALSLAVLAVEELGKLFILDGLLFARRDDRKAAAFSRSDRSHSVKLSATAGIPLLLAALSRVDPRHKTDRAFRESLRISLLHLKEVGNQLLMRLGQDGFLNLDHLKQDGFYVSRTGRGFIAPCDAINSEIAQLVHTFAWRATATLDFLLENGNLERYF